MMEEIQKESESEPLSGDNPIKEKSKMQTDTKKGLFYTIMIKNVIPLVISALLTITIVRIFYNMGDNNFKNQNTVNEELKSYGDSVMRSYIKSRIQQLEEQKHNLLDSIILYNNELTREMTGKRNSQAGYGARARTIETEIIQKQVYIRQLNAEIEKYNTELDNIK